MRFTVIMLLSAIIALVIVQVPALDNEVQNADFQNVNGHVSEAAEPKEKEDKVPLNFLQAFIKTFFIILVSEIGDKTFFIAAIMAMKHPRIMVFIGAISALALMTVISVLCGWAFSVIPKRYTYYGSVALFIVFGVKMIYDGMKMSPTEGQEEYEEVQSELRKRDEERAKRLKNMKSKKDSSTTPDDGAAVTMEVLPVSNSDIAISNSGQDISNSNNLLNRSSSHQFEKGVLRNKDVESAYTSNDNSKKKIIHVLWHIILQAFTLTFLAEWGDRSQIATMALAVKDNKLGITVGGIVGHSLCTGMAVIGGRFIAQKISVKTVTIIGGFVFILFALITLFVEEPNTPEMHN